MSTVRRVDHRWTLVGEEDARRAAAGQAALTDGEIAAMFGPDETADHLERFITTVEFSDGLGRLLQTRTQADEMAISDIGLPDDLSPAARTIAADAAGAAPAVIVSGWTVYDDKGRPVIRYEPFRDTGYDYAAPAKAVLADLASTMQHYDPAGRPTVTVAPDGSQTWMVRGVPADLADPGGAEPTPWETYTYSAEDNASRTHPTWTLDRAAQWDTPSSAVIDALGRTVSTVERGLADDVVTSFGYDIDGHLLSVTDPLGRLAAASVYDLAGLTWLSWRLDSGASRAVYDAAGAVVEHRDDKGALVLTAYDAGHRPVRQWAADRVQQAATLRQVTVFGDDQPESGLSPDEAAVLNSRGRVAVSYDEVGRVSYAGYDLDGNPLATTRQVIRPDLLVLQLPTRGDGQWNGTSYAVDWQPAAAETLMGHADTLLDPVPYETGVTFDALGRRKTTTYPVDATGQRAVAAFTYGRGGGITGIAVDGEPYLQEAGYDAQGRQTFAFLGNGVFIRRSYHPRTQRLRRQRAEHAVMPSPDGWACDGPVLQDTSFRYDLAGNLLTLGDRTPGCGVAPDDPDAIDRQFSYDALGRLLSATGRETDIVSGQPWIEVPRSTDITKARAYTETYDYNLVGSVVGLRHRTNASGAGAYTRTLSVADDSNELVMLSSGNVKIAYSYDPCGNLLTEADSRFFEWDHVNRMAAFRNQAVGSLPTIYAQYRYDAAGQRTLKIVRRNGGPDEIILYLDGLERVLRGNIGSPLAAFDELHVTDGSARLASIRRGNPLPDDPMPEHQVRYQLDDHLLSVTSTLAADGMLLSREEYLPYGETAFGSYARKRYRFTGKERDEESGLYYMGARYYAPWQCRWTAADPAGFADGWNLYAYVRGNPLRYADDDGRAATEVDQKRQEVTNWAGRGAAAADKRANARNVEQHLSNLPRPTARQRTPTRSLVPGRELTVGLELPDDFFNSGGFPMGGSPGPTLPNMGSRGGRGIGGVIDVIGLINDWWGKEGKDGFSKDGVKERFNKFDKDWGQTWRNMWYDRSIRVILGRTPGDIGGVEGLGSSFEADRGGAPSPYRGKFLYVDEWIARSQTTDELTAIRSSLTKAHTAWQTNRPEYADKAGLSILTLDRDQPITDDQFNEMLWHLDLKLHQVQRGEYCPPSAVGDYPAPSPAVGRS